MKRIHKGVIKEGIDSWVTFTSSTVIVGQSISCFGKLISLSNKTCWRTKKTDKFIKIINSEDDEIALLGIKMLFNILNFKERKIDELIKTSI